MTTPLDLIWRAGDPCADDASPATGSHITQGQVEFLISLADHLLRTLAEHDIKAAVAGGFCRDVLHMVMPKDIDVWIMDDTDEEMLAAALDALNIKHEVVERKGGAEHYVDHQPGRELDFVLRATVGNMAVDFIAPAEVPQHIVQLVEAFDCTINMAYIEKDTGCIRYITDPRLPKHAFFAEQAGLGRLLKMRGKYPDKHFEVYRNMNQYLHNPYKEERCADH